MILIHQSPEEFVIESQEQLRMNQLWMRHTYRSIRQMTQPIQLLNLQLDVQHAATALQKSIRWNSYQLRTLDPSSPHREADDIWLRYGSLDDEAVRTNQPFTSEWYAYPELVAVCKPLVDAVYSTVQGVELGGVLITRIPAGKQVYPHTDKGWHASNYSKYCVCIRANLEQSFCFKGSSLWTVSGQVFFFDNSYQHYVLNPSSEDRISLIACIKTPRGIHQP